MGPTTSWLRFIGCSLLLFCVLLMLKHKHNIAQNIANNTMLFGNGSCQEFLVHLLFFLASSLWAATCTQIAKHCSYRQLSCHALVICIFPSRSVLRRTVHCQLFLSAGVSPRELPGPHQHLDVHQRRVETSLALPAPAAPWKPQKCLRDTAPHCSIGDTPAPMPSGLEPSCFPMSPRKLPGPHQW